MTPRRVLKLGGSLFAKPDLVAAVSAWLASQPPAQNLVIVGGGGAVDAMRELAQRFRLDEPAMHWRCIQLLRATYEVASELFPTWRPVAANSEFETLAAAPPQPGVWLLRVDCFYSPATHVDSGLPEGWGTTTDSLAAYLARRTRADELVLLKSCPLPPGAAVDRLAAAGIVDAAFETALPPDSRLRIERLHP